MAWATCGGPHASIYLQTIRRLASPPNYLRSPLYALAFTLVRSCFHVLHAIPILSLLYRVPATTSSSTHHTSFTSSLASPKLKIRRHLVFDFGPTTAQTQIPWALAPGAHFMGTPNCAPYFYLFGARGPCPLLPIFKATSPRTHPVGVLATGAWGFHNNFFLGPPHLRNVDHRHASPLRHMHGLSKRPSTGVFELRRSEHPLFSPPLLTPGRG